MHLGIVLLVYFINEFYHLQEGFFLLKEGALVMVTRNLYRYANDAIYFNFVIYAACVTAACTVVANTLVRMAKWLLNKKPMSVLT